MADSWVRPEGDGLRIAIPECEPFLAPVDALYLVVWLAGRTVVDVEPRPRARTALGRARALWRVHPDGSFCVVRVSRLEDQVTAHAIWASWRAQPARRPGPKPATCT